MIRLRRLLASGLLGPLVAAALAGGVLASVWVARLSAGLQPVSDTSVRSITGTDEELSLADDARGVPLLDDVRLTRGEQVRRCVEVETRAVSDPSPLALHVDAGDAGPLAEHLQVAVASGPATDDPIPCAERRPAATTAGRLSELLVTLAPDGPGWQAHDPEAGVAGWWYRVDVRLVEDAPAGLAGRRVRDLRLRWTSDVPSATDGSLAERTALFAAGVAEDALAPIVALGVVALLFLGVHRRIDSADPKLALAPIDRRTVAFTRVEER